MFLLPITRSPGEHGTEDHTSGVISQARRFVRQNMHMGVNGFIACALLIQGFSAAGVIPAEVWAAEPGYAMIVCMGLVTISASVLFSLKSLLAQPSPEIARSDVPPLGGPNVSPQVSEIRSGQDDLTRVALVIEASRTMQAIVGKSLARSAIAAVFVDSEAGAEKALQTRKFDLLILGAAFSRGICSAALEQVYENCRRRGIRILALTMGEGGAQTSGIDGVVEIPILPDKLARSAKQLIAQTDLRTHAPESELRDAPTRELPELLPEPLDARALGDLEKLGGHDFVRDIVAQFVADAALVLTTLAAAVAERDQKAFREQAHALRSCAANVGAQNVYRMCLAWRDLDAQEIAASGVECMKMLEQEFERVRAALTPMLRDDVGAGSGSKAA